MAMTKTQQVLTKDGETGDVIRFSGPDDLFYRALYLSEFDWIDLGRPETVTVTIEPGDTLNPLVPLPDGCPSCGGPIRAHQVTEIQKIGGVNVTATSPCPATCGWCAAARRARPPLVHGGVMPSKIPLPKQVVVGPFTFTVVCELLTILQDQQEINSRLYGVTDKKKERISLHPENSVGVQRETLMHEILHAVNAVSAIDADMGAEDEERFVRRTAPVLLDVLRRNPKLVTYLLAP